MTHAPELGYALTVAALALAVYGSGVSAVSAASGRLALRRSSERAAIGVFVLTTCCMLLLVYAFLTFDFSIRYVATNTNRGTPFYYRITALWGALEGSIILWAWMLSLYTLIVVAQYRRRQPEFYPWVLAVMLGIMAFFFLVMTIPAPPFARLTPIPPDGRGLNPLLEDSGMITHPVALYLGFTGFTVPFAFAMAALIRGRTGDEWITITRRWTIVAWYFLSLGLLIGGWWSYHVLGWGGYWAWDPVENAAFMPWLTATALLHSVMIQERRRMLKLWNLTLIILTFGLTLFGTFLTRSGIIGSVHAFSQGSVGQFFLAFLALVLLGSFCLLAWRFDRLRGQTAARLGGLARVGLLAQQRPAPRRHLHGLLRHRLSAAVRGGARRQGERRRALLQPGQYPRLPRLALPDGRGAAHRLAPRLRRQPAPELPEAGHRGHRRRGRPPAPRHRQCPGPPVHGARAFVTVTIALDFFRAVRARRRTAPGWLSAAGGLLLNQNRRYGGFVVHLGILVVALGVAGSQAWSVQTETTLERGQSVELAGYRVRFDRLAASEESNHFKVTGTFTVANGRDPLAVLAPAKKFYPQEQTPIAYVDYRLGLIEDLYVVLGDFARDGSHATIKVQVNRMVSWLWIGGLILTLGAALAILPDRRRPA